MALYSILLFWVPLKIECPFPLAFQQSSGLWRSQLKGKLSHSYQDYKHNTWFIETLLLPVIHIEPFWVSLNIPHQMVSQYPVLTHSTAGWAFVGFSSCSFCLGGRHFQTRFATFAGISFWEKLHWTCKHCQHVNFSHSLCILLVSPSINRNILHPFQTYSSHSTPVPSIFTSQLSITCRAEVI